MAVGWLSLRLRQWAREPRVEITLSLMTPYLAFWVPAHLGGSGVLATVACGLYVSWNGPRLIPSATRLQGIFFWDLIVYLIEGLVFLDHRPAGAHADRADACLLDPRPADRDRLDDADRDRGAFHLGVSGDLYPALGQSVACASAIPRRPGSGVFFLAFTGVRGVDSLAVALAIPYAIVNGQPFPHRDLILFVTFGVIIVTLIGQGVMLPWVVRWLGLHRLGKKERKDEIRAELAARQAALKEVRKRLEKVIKEHDLPDEAIEHLRTRNQSRLQILPTNLTEGLDHMRQTAKIKAELIEAERDFIYQLLRDGKITDEARRRIEYELDLEEASVANRATDGGGWM